MEDISRLKIADTSGTRRDEAEICHKKESKGLRFEIFVAIKMWIVVPWVMVIRPIT
jgi:hypothetical protein